MLLVINSIIGKIHVFQLCNLNHTFSPTYLYIYEINHLREKSHQVQRSFCVCVCFFGKNFLLAQSIIARQFSCVPFKTFSENSHRRYLASDISILSFNLFKKIVLASQSQSMSNGQKGFFALLESFFYRSKKLGKTPKLSISGKKRFVKISIDISRKYFSFLASQRSVLLFYETLDTLIEALKAFTVRQPQLCRQTGWQIQGSSTETI